MPQPQNIAIATQALELGYDGVLVNTAVARATDLVQMGRAFRLPVLPLSVRSLAGHWIGATAAGLPVLPHSS